MALRTIRGFVAIAKERDPGSVVNETLIRKLVKEGIIPYIQNGNRAILEVETTFTVLEKMITESIAETSNNSNRNTLKQTPSTHSLDPYARAEAKLQRLKAI